MPVAIPTTSGRAVPLAHSPHPCLPERRPMSVSLLRPTLALSCLAPLALAQNDYGLNWQTLHGPLPGATVSATQISDLIGFGADPTATASYRVCLSIDQAQGGTNQDGTTDVTWFRITQGFGPAAGGLNIGLVSFLASSVDSLEGDACFTSLLNFGPGPNGGVVQGFDQTGNPITLRNSSATSVLVGPFPGVTLPVPTVWSVYFQFIGSAGGIQLPNTLGTDANDCPLLSHLIMEVQGPINDAFGPGDQYFAFSTTEQIGQNPLGTGGVTNGNSLQGQGIFGVPADLTGAAAHHRIAVGTSGFLALTTTLGLGGGIGTDAVLGGFATTTPALRGVRDDDTGAGSNDWVVSTVPTSTIDLRVIDNLAGAEGSALAGGASTTVTNPDLAANFPVFLWSCSSNDTMLQNPTSWDGDASLGLCQPGSVALGQVDTLRHGPQFVPIVVDICTLNFLGKPAITLGSTYSASGDPFIDSFTDALFWDGIGTDGPGVSTLAGGPVKIVGEPNPALAGTVLGVAAAGFQADGVTGARGLTEIATSLTIALQ